MIRTHMDSIEHKICLTWRRLHQLQMRLKKEDSLLKYMLILGAAVHQRHDLKIGHLLVAAPNAMQLRDINIQ